MWFVQADIYIRRLIVKYDTALLKVVDIGLTVILPKVLSTAIDAWPETITDHLCATNHQCHTPAETANLQGRNSLKTKRAGMGPSDEGTMPALSLRDDRIRNTSYERPSPHGVYST